MTINRLNQGVTNQVLVKAVSGQTTNLLELQDSTGAVVSSIGPTGALGGTIGNSGLVHIETRTISAVASESFNDVFTSQFTNYRIMGTLNTASGVPRIRLRYRVGGSDFLSANYRFQELRSGSTTVTSTRFSNQTSQDLGLISNVTSNFVIDVFEPELVAETGFTSLSQFERDAVAFFGGALTVTNSFTGFTLIPASSTVAGTISIFGYAKA